MSKISVAIVTYNEENNIEDCLRSVDWADEIVVIDGQSTDGTSEIAKKMGAKVSQVPNQPLIEKNKNLAFSKCSGDWILNIDSDERVSLELKEEIQNVTSGDNSFSGYEIPYKNIIFRKWIKHTGWYPDYQLRLFKNGKGKFPVKNVHEKLQIDGEVGRLSSSIEHLHYKSISEFIRKLDSYTTIEANSLIEKGQQVTWTDAIKFPSQEFLRRFFDWEGYKDGIHGLVLSLLMGFYWFAIFAKIWERNGFKEEELSLEEFRKALKTPAKEWQYWFITKKISDSRNGFRKLSYRLQRKFKN